jgi:hypothetical protein
MGIILDEDSIQDVILNLEDNLIIAEYFQSLFQSTIPVSMLGKRRREDIDITKAQQVINEDIIIRQEGPV